MLSRYSQQGLCLQDTHKPLQQLPPPAREAAQAGVTAGRPLSAGAYRTLYAEFILRWFEGVPGNPENSEGGQEAQKELKRPEGPPHGYFRSLGLLAFLLTLFWSH